MIHRLKPLFLILLSFLLFSFVGNKHKNDLERNHLKGKIKKLTWLTYSFNSKTGHMDALAEKSIGIYDSTGNCITSTLYEKNGKQIGSSKTRFDGSGRRIIKTIFDGKGVMSELNVIKYDSNSNQIFMDCYEKDNFLSSIVFYNYDINWNEIAEIIYYPSTRSMTMEYDTVGKLIGISESHAFTKDSIVGMEGIDSTWRAVKTEFKYDINGNKIEIDEYLNSIEKMQHKTIYQYDKMGNEIQVSGYEEPSGKLKARYDCKYVNFDESGNWTKQIRFHNNVVEEITKRTIEYYQ